jgi:cytochrome oxidase Cu insertion factor (SCO1/SenC/PrrC family)
MAWMFTWLRMWGISAAAAASGLANAITRREAGERVALEPGDVAPPFTLRGSDGVTYRLADLIGHPVVIAWFPKAFTSG